MTYRDAAIQEYQALREEVLARFERRSSRLAITWAGISALLATGTIAKTPELGCVALLLVCSGWTDELRWFDHTVRIGSYIRIILEPQIEGLQWERALDLVEEPQKEVGFLKRLFGSLFSPYGVFTVACITFSIILYAEFPPSSLIRGVLFFCLFLIGLIFWIRVVGEAVNVPRRRRIWNERFSKISEQLNFGE